MKGVQNMYEIFEQLCNERNLSSYKVSKLANVTQTSLSNWKNGKSIPSTQTLQKLADFFEVTIDYLMTGKEEKEESVSQLTKRDERDIAKDLENIMNKLSNKEAGPASFEGQELSDESAELFREELEIALKRLKLINKDKYNPNKNKK